MSIKSLYDSYVRVTDGLRDLAPLIFRLVLAYGFFEPAWNKIQDVHAIGEWFESMELPAPYLQAWLATLTECLGVILLAVGLGTRIIAVPLVGVMLVAIKTVHWENGFAAGDNGYEIPFYYICMLLCLVFLGSGRFSLDYLLARRAVKN
jgi:putative oxidoreductase